MKISFCKINIFISYPLVALLCMSVIASKNTITVIAVLSAVLHETGHLAVMRRFSDDEIDVRAGVFELAICDYSREVSGYRRDIAVTCAGPVVNIVLWAVFFILYKYTMWDTAHNIAMVNISLGIFNLLPIETTDGGQLLKIILAKTLSVTAADRVMLVVSIVFIIPVAVAGFYILLNSAYNYTMLAAVIYFVTALVVRFME